MNPFSAITEKDIKKWLERRIKHSYVITAESGHFIYALCNDGTLWRKLDKDENWTLVKEIPQGPIEHREERAPPPAPDNGDLIGNSKKQWVDATVGKRWGTVDTVLLTIILSFALSALYFSICNHYRYPYL